MNLQTLIFGLASKHDADIEAIGAIEGDVIGSSLFVNILLSVGAFFASLMILLAMMTFIWSTMGFSDDYIWLHLLIIGGVMSFAGYKSQSSKGIFGLRMATFFMVFGKLALIGLVFERVGAFVTYDIMWDNLKFFAPMALILAILNMYVSKIKLEIFVLLTICISTTTFFASGIPLFYGDTSSYILPAFGYEFWVRAVIWGGVAYMLLELDNKHRNRLPFYGFIMGQMLIINSSIFFSHSNIFDLFGGFDLILIEHIAYNLILLLPSVYLVWRLHRELKFKITWQYWLGLGLLLIGTLLPISSFYMIIFCFIFGYAKRDNFLLISAYILTPLFIYNLYNDLQLTLDRAAIVAALIGIASLLVWAMVKYSRFEKQEA